MFVISLAGAMKPKSGNGCRFFDLIKKAKENNAIKQAKIKKYFFIKKEQRNLRYSIF